MRNTRKRYFEFLTPLSGFRILFCGKVRYHGRAGEEKPYLPDYTDSDVPGIYGIRPVKQDTNVVYFPILKRTGEQRAHLPEYKDSEVRDIYMTQLDKRDTNVIYKKLSGRIKEYDLARDPGSGITFTMK